MHRVGIPDDLLEQAIAILYRLEEDAEELGYYSRSNEAIRIADELKVYFNENKQ